MSRITGLRPAMICLLTGTLGVCPAWGEQGTTTPLGLDAAVRATAWQTATENSEVTLTGAISRKGHGAVGEFDINLPLDTYAEAGVEPRSGGLTQVVLTFSGPADGVDVQASSGSVGAVLVEGSQATVELSGVPNASCLVLGVSGVAGLESEIWVRVRILAGDVTADGTVNVLDLVQIRNQLNQPVSGANFRADVNADGSINILDLVQVRNRLNSLAVCPQVDMVPIPAGEFQMGDTFGEGSSAERPVHAVDVDAFYMDRYEVTNQQYAAALNWAYGQGGQITVTSGVVYKAGSGTSFPYCDTTLSSSYSRITWNGNTFGVNTGKENHPMAMVSWYGAVAYCNWRSAMQGKPLCYDLSTWNCNWGSGYCLPTEAEWEKAARGGASGRRFPWSDSDLIQHARANYCSSTSDSYDTSLTRGNHPVWGTGSPIYTSPVGFFDGSLRYKVDFNWPGSATSYQTANGANGYGLYDMAGNVWEWCNDWYGGTYYSGSPSNNPRGPASGWYRVLRGGSWGNNATYCRVAYRNGDLSPVSRHPYVGFRLVASAALDSP